MSESSVKRQGLHSKLVKVFAIQLGLISAVTLLGVFLSAMIVEHVLIKQALDGEAEYFWSKFDEDPSFPLPDTQNLTAYMAPDMDRSRLPEGYRDVSDGFQRIDHGDAHPIIHVSRNNNHLLVLVFEESQVSQLAFFFGVAPLAFVLLVIYIPAWFTYQSAKRAISPVIKLAQRVEKLSQSRRPDLTPDFGDLEHSSDMEVASLIEAFEHYGQTVNHFLQRERNFTRYASHELRTPLAVMNGSLSLLRKTDLSDKQTGIVDRMKPVIDDMESLLSALLLLSRDQEPELPESPIILNDLIKPLVERARLLVQDRDLEVLWSPQQLLQAIVPERLFSIVMTNLILNSINYTDSGRVTVTAEQGRLVISDTGRGMSDDVIERAFEPFYRGDRDRTEVKGYGLGLSIVKRICEQLDWSIELTSTVGEGTTIELAIPGVDVIGTTEGNCSSSEV